jgi:alpha-beta hydrolase superfamily lysophospholipase
VAATLFPRNERMSTAANRTTRASHSSSVPAVGETSYLRCSEGWIGYDVAGAGSLVVLVPGMGDLRAGYRFLGPDLRAAGYLVLAGPFVRNGKTSARQRLLLRVAMAPPWAAISWKSYLPKLYAGRRPADFEEYRDQVIASLRRPGHAKAFSATTRTSHDLAEARLADVTAPALVVMGEQDPDFPDPRAEADWIARALRAQVVMVPEAGHYPQSQRPDITTGAVLRFLESVTGRA